MPSNDSIESLSTAYFTISDSEATSPLSPPTTAVPSFYTNYTRGGNVINVAGNYNATIAGPATTCPRGRANYAPTGAITRHFVGRAKELLEIHRAFNTPREANCPARYTLCGPGGVGKSQLVLQYAERAYAQGRYSHVFHMTASTAGHIRDGLAHILCLVQTSDYTRTKSVEALEALRWLDNADPAIAWLLIVDRAALGSVEYLRTHLPRKNPHGNILFATQSEAVAEALADENGRDAVLKIGPLDHVDAVRLLLLKSKVRESAKTIKQASAIVEWLDHLPVPIQQAASFANHFQGKLDRLIRLLQEGRWTSLARWDTRLSGYEYITFESAVQAQYSRTASENPRAADLLKVLCYLDPRGISLHILVDGARSLPSQSEKTAKPPRFAALRNGKPLPSKNSTHSKTGKERAAIALRFGAPYRTPPPLPPPTTGLPWLLEHISLVKLKSVLRDLEPPTDPGHPLRALLAAIASQEELHNLVRYLQQNSLICLETVARPDSVSGADKHRPSHALRIPRLLREIIRGTTTQTGEESAYFDIAANITVSAFLERREDASLRAPSNGTSAP